jgi:hypothetical protein
MIQSPNQKTLEFIALFHNNAESRNKIGLYDEDLHRYNCIQCALIAVNEIQKCTKYENQKFINDRFSENYWQEIKEELEKL